MDSIKKQIENVNSKKAFADFLRRLISDYNENPQEWEATTVGEYLDSMLSWIEDYSACEANDIDWDNPDYSTFAKILYMGKLYE